MVLKGEAKRAYQRRYMRRRRAEANRQVVRPVTLDPVRPTIRHERAEFKIAFTEDSEWLDIP